MEQLETDRFVEGLRRAVRTNLEEREKRRQPKPHLQQYAYNNATKELSAVHGHPDYQESYPSSRIDTIPTHIADNLEHHICLFEHTYATNHASRLRQNLAASSDDLYPE